MTDSVSDARAVPISAPARNEYIDGLRGLSVLIVAGSHGLFSTMPPQLMPWAGHFFKGYFGVAIFFTLSGFLITTNSLERYGHISRINMREFYVMRLGRIAPCLFLFMAAMTALWLMGIPRFVPAEAKMIPLAIYNAVTFQYNWFYLTGGNSPGLYPWAPLWSLSIEELFYIAFPIVCFFARRSFVVIGLLGAAILCGPIVRSEHVGTYYFWGNADLLAFGCISAIVSRRLSQSAFSIKAAPYLAAVSLAALLGLVWTQDVTFKSPMAPSAIAAAAAVFLFCVVRIPAPRNFFIRSVSKVIGPFGKASYEIYLFHAAFIALIDLTTIHLFGGINNSLLRVLWTIVSVGTLVLFGTLVSRYYSEPANRRLRKLYSSQRTDVDHREVSSRRSGQVDLPSTQIRAREFDRAALP